MRSLAHVAVVDDDPDILAIARLALGQLGGLRVSTFGSGAQALEGLGADLPDLVLLDVMMPGLDGPATLRALREEPALEALPVVFLTARREVTEDRTLDDADVLGAIAKPFDPMSLAGQLRELWAAG